MVDVKERDEIMNIVTGDKGSGSGVKKVEE